MTTNDKAKLQLMDITEKYQNFLKEKSKSGLHSPSPSELIKELGLTIDVDACFLCNPYAFDLYMDHYKDTDLREYMKFYPPQNNILSKKLGDAFNLNPDYLMLGNGAIQLIELILREFKQLKKCIVSPTFSTYYETDRHNITFFTTTKEDDFKINVEQLIDFCKKRKVEVLVIVNPNNPTGSIIEKKDIKRILSELKIKTIVDESFIDFFDPEHSVEKEVYNNPNLIVIRSLSKDFGIAGLRLGYAVMNPTLKNEIFSQYGLCWNINGLAHFFIELLNQKEFLEKYKDARNKYVLGRDKFFHQLSKLKKMKVYPSYANFFVLDCFDNAENVFSSLLFNKNIYTRILNDKLDLEPTFLRIACSNDQDNTKVFNALQEIEKKL